MSEKHRSLSPLFTWRSAICDSDLPSTTRHVLLTLSLHMNERGGSCFPSTRTLASETGLSRRAVEKHLRLAHDARWIQKREQGRKADGTFRRAEYTATVPGERGSHGPGEPHTRPGEPDDIDQGNEVPHRTSVRGRQQRGRSSVVSQPGEPDVEKSSEERWNDRLAPLARQLGGDGFVADILAWCRDKVDDTERAARILEGAHEMREDGRLTGWIEPGDPMWGKHLNAQHENSPPFSRQAEAYWIQRRKRKGPKPSSDGLTKPQVEVASCSKQRATGTDSTRRSERPTPTMC